jgi:hypothetical protein
MEPNADWIQRAQDLWRDTFELIPVEDWRPDEIELMRQLCQSMTDLDEIEVELSGAPKLMAGSHGGTIANPLLAERRQLRGLVLSIQKALKLPPIDELGDEEYDEYSGNVIPLDEPRKPMSRTESAKIAANAKWDKVRKNGGGRAGLA